MNKTFYLTQSELYELLDGGENASISWFENGIKITIQKRD